MSETKWTRKPPSVPGWYWFKSYNVTFKPMIVRLTPSGHFLETGAITQYVVTDYTGYWSGPLTHD